LDGKEQLALDNWQQAFLRGVLRRAEGGGVSNLEQQLVRIAKTHRVQMALIESVQLLNELRERERQADEDRRARLARIAAANEQ
jgi:hypothetical protein